jgi:lysophospholipase L1-like esterase
MNRCLVGLACAVLLVAPARRVSGQAAAAPRLELRTGDRVIFVGNTLAERMQQFNGFETRLMVRFADLDLTVRNLGWSGDTITLQPRPLKFGDAVTHLTEQHADVILLFFGLNESFDGDAGLPRFEQDLDAYLKAHLAHQYNGTSAPRLALISPIAHEKLARLPRVDVDARNTELARYTDAMRRVAGQNSAPFVDLYTPTKKAMETASSPLTINGIHLNEDGDRIVAGLLMTGLGFDTAADAPATPSASAKKTFEALRASIAQKNQDFFYRFRPVNAEYVMGRRFEPFGSVNFPPEMKELDKIVTEHDRRIWKQARALQAQRAFWSGL